MSTTGMQGERTLTLADLRLDRTELRDRIARNARYGRDHWQDNDERWDSLQRARSAVQLRRAHLPLTVAEMDDVLAWGMIAPKDELIADGVVDAPEPVVRAALARLARYQRVRKALRG